MIALVLALVALQGGGTPAIIDRVHLDPHEEVSFHAIVVPETVFVGQPATYELGVFISDEMRQRLRRNPEFVPADLQSVLAYDLHESRSARVITREGRTYEVHVFRRALFPLSPGRVVVPPARLSYAVPLGTSFFSREESRLLRSESVSIVAIAPPTAGRPADWSGAVGDWRISSGVSEGSRVGDPFVLTVRVFGEGNVNLLPRPTFAVPWGTAVEGPERVVIDTLAPTVRGAKEFDWLVTPTVEGRVTIPPLTYAYFEPTARTYRVASSAPLSIRVAAGGLAAIDTAASAAAPSSSLPFLTHWSPAFPDAPDSTWWYWVIVLIVPISGVVSLWRRRPRRSAPRGPAAALEGLRGIANAEPARVRAALCRALSERLGQTDMPWADRDALRRVLRHSGVTARTVNTVVALLAELDDAVYGTGHAPQDVAARAVAAYASTDGEARRYRQVKATRRVGAALILFTAATLRAQTAGDPRALFDRGVAALRTGDTAEAAADFWAAARGEPSAGAAWMNAGAVSWIQADTAAAAVAWQRALRADPLDSDARSRLALIGSDAGARARTVWPVPRRMPAWIALVLWIGGWVGLVRSRRRRVAVSALALAVVLAALSRVQHRRLVDPRVAIVAAPAPLRALPALGADGAAAPLMGELVTVEERNGVWVRVRTSAGQDGWIDAARIMNLEGRTWRE